MHAVLMVDLSLRESKYTALSRLIYRVNGARMYDFIEQEHSAIKNTSAPGFAFQPHFYP
jgi:hypothetical protein